MIFMLDIFYLNNIDNTFVMLMLRALIITIVKVQSII